MKIKKSTLEALKVAAGKGVKDATKKGVRKSSGTADIEVTKEHFSLLRYIRGISSPGQNLWKDAEHEEQVFKALNTRVGAEGGHLVPTTETTEVIELLDDTAILRQMPGVRKINMPTPQLTIGRLDTGPTVSWGAENATIDSDTSIALGKVALELNKCVCLVPLSRELVAYANPSMDAMVRATLVDKIGLAQDLAAWEGTGGDQPLGLYNNPRILNTDLSAAADFDDIADATLQIELQNADITGWVMNPLMKNRLRKLKDAFGRYLYRDGVTVAGGVDDSMPTLDSKPVFYSNQIPRTLRPGANETYILYGRWSDLIIGDGVGDQGMRLESTNTGGDSFAKDQVWIKIVSNVDFTLRHAATFGRIVGCA